MVVSLKGEIKTKVGINSQNDINSLLQKFADDALLDNGKNVLGVEVMWTPTDPSYTLEERSIIADYPELARF